MAKIMDYIENPIHSNSITNLQGIFSNKYTNKKSVII